LVTAGRAWHIALAKLELVLVTVEESPASTGHRENYDVTARRTEHVAPTFDKDLSSASRYVALVEHQEELRVASPDALT